MSAMFVSSIQRQLSQLARSMVIWEIAGSSPPRDDIKTAVAPQISLLLDDLGDTFFIFLKETPKESTKFYPSICLPREIWKSLICSVHTWVTKTQVWVILTCSVSVKLFHHSSWWVVRFDRDLNLKTNSGEHVLVWTNKKIKMMTKTMMILTVF